MVLGKVNVKTSEDSVAAQRVVSNIHNMQWLKSRTDTERRDGKEDETSANMNGRKKQMRKPKPKNSKPANDQKTQGKKNGTSQQLNNAWIDGNQTTAKLFANPEPAADPPEEMDEDLKLAIENSLCMMHESLTLGHSQTNGDKVDERTEEDIYWSGKVQNLPSPTSRETEKASDTNNNASVAKPSVSGSSTKVSHRREDQSTRSKALPDGEEAKVEQPPLQKSAVKLMCSTQERVHYVDQFNRVDGQNESHLFMGRGARKKEQMYISQQQQEYQRLQQDNRPQPITSRSSNESAFSHQEANRHETNRANQQYSAREPRNQNSSRRPPFGQGARSFPSDKYRYRRDQAKQHSENAESQTFSNDKKSDIPVKEVSNAPNSEVTKGNVLPTRADIPIDGKSQSEEISSKKSTQVEKNSETSVNTTEKVLRLTGFNSRFNTPANDESFDLPRPEVTASLTASFDPRDNHSVADSSWKVETAGTRQPPPGFSGPPLRPPDYFPPSSERPKWYERLAIDDPSLYQFLMQRNNVKGPSTKVTECGKENFDNFDCDRYADEKSLNFPTQEVSSYEEKIVSDDRPIETQPVNEYRFPDEFVPARQFPEESHLDPNFYGNEHLPVVYDDSEVYCPMLSYNVNVPYGYQHVPMPSHHPMQNCIPPEYSPDDNVVPPETARYSPRSTIPQYCVIPSYCQPVPDPRFDPRTQFAYENLPHHHHHHRRHGPIATQNKFSDPSFYTHNHFVNYHDNRRFPRPNCEGNRGIPLNVSRGPRFPPQQRFIPDTGHGRGRV